MELHGPEVLIRRTFHSLLQLQRDPQSYLKKKVLPIFILSRRRPKEAQLNFSPAHALGDASKETVVIVVIPEDELKIYLERWPQSLFLTLPSVSSETGTGYPRWAIQVCTSWGNLVPRDNRSNAISFGVPYYFTFDDLVSSFYANKDLPEADIAAANAHNTSKACIVRKYREEHSAGFKCALMALQCHSEAPTCGIGGFLRDDATCTTKIRTFTLGSCSLYKVVFVNNAVLNSLRVPITQTANPTLDYMVSRFPCISTFLDSYMLKVLCAINGSISSDVSFAALVYIHNCSRNFALNQ